MTLVGLLVPKGGGIVLYQLKRIMRYDICVVGGIESNIIEVQNDNLYTT